MSNKGQSAAFVNQVLLLVHEHGMFGAVKPGEPRGGLPLDKVHGDIVGLPFTTAVRSSAQVLDLSGAVAEAEREAQAVGHDVWASVHARRGGGPGESYVVTTLSVWLLVMARIFPDAVTR